MKAKELCIPKKILEQHAIWLGKTRAGKSSSMRHVVEWLLDQGQRVCIVDPKGDWHGLKLSADGKSAGFKVILLGSFKDPTATDVPINDQSGKHIAELIASGNRPCVIGLRGWSNAAQSRFWIDFASTLFNSNLTGGLKLFLDEVQNFAPKERTGIGQENEALGWTKRLLSEGSGLGLTIFCGSQRPASVHNGVLTQCETLVAMRVIHASDRKASKEWIDGNGDKQLGQKVLDSLASLNRGEAFVWSPEANFGPEKVQFPMFETFDSFAPPQLQKKISFEGWATVNLDDVKAKLASVIEEAKANDPKELKKLLAAEKQKSGALEKTVKQLENAKPQKSKLEAFKYTPPKLPKLISDGRLNQFEKQIARLGKMEEMLISHGQYVHALIEVGKGIVKNIVEGQKNIVAAAQPPSHLPPMQVSVMRPAIKIHLPPKPLAPPPVIQPVGNIELNAGQLTILAIVRMLKARGLTPERDMIARWHDTPKKSGLHPKGGTYGTNLAGLRNAGLLNGCEITAEGMKFAAEMATGFDAALVGLNEQCQTILQKLYEGQEFTRDTMAAELGVHPKGGTYGTNLSLLRTRGLLPSKGTIKLTDAAKA